LQYYRHPQKINRQVARYISFLEDFHYQLKHIPGAHNWADALSRKPDHDDGSGDNDQMVALPDELFLRAVFTMMLDASLRREQKEKLHQIEEWRNKYHLVRGEDHTWYKDQALVVASDEEAHQQLLKMYHDTLMAGHPGTLKMLRLLARDYWWPNMQKFVQEYVRGCARCQENKANTHLNSPPLQPFIPDPQARPFSTIAVDFIVKLPVSNGYDTILTVMDHDYTKAVILMPCREDMGSLDIARLYLEWVFPFVGIPEKVISDWDTRFMLKVFKELCEILQIKQNITSAYHPQTNGQSEKTNQHVETALRIFGNFRQDDWSELLPIV
jgi:hypothetical protein